MLQQKKKAQAQKQKQAFRHGQRKEKRARKGQKPNACPRRRARAITLRHKGIQRGAAAGKQRQLHGAAQHIPRQNPKGVQRAQKPWKQRKKHNAQMLLCHGLVPFVLVPIPGKADIMRRVYAAKKLCQRVFQPGAGALAHGAQRHHPLHKCRKQQKRQRRQKHFPPGGPAACRAHSRRAHQLCHTNKSARGKQRQGAKRERPLHP